jgi:hypothetical protein
MIRGIVSGEDKKLKLTDKTAGGVLRTPQTIFCSGQGYKYHERDKENVNAETYREDQMP